jgi:hypothetical protein
MHVKICLKFFQFSTTNNSNGNKNSLARESILNFLNRSLQVALFSLKRRFWNTNSDPKFGQRRVVLVIPMPGEEKGSGIPFRFASF